MNEQHNTFHQTTSRDGSMASRISMHNGLDNESFAKLAENRSIYGSYLDNSLAYDPNKDKKSVYDVIYTQEIYDPWGKLIIFRISLKQL